MSLYCIVENTEDEITKVISWWDTEFGELPFENALLVGEEVRNEFYRFNNNSINTKTLKTLYIDYTTDEEKVINIRRRRDKELTNIDKYQGVFLYNDLTDIQKKELKEYRQALLDAPKTMIFPKRPKWIKI